MFISLPGLTLAIDEVAKFEMVMETARKAIHDFINDEPDDVKVYEMEHPDVLLWAVWCIQQYAKMVSRDQCREKYGTLLQDIMEYLRRRIIRTFSCIQTVCYMPTERKRLSHG